MTRWLLVGEPGGVVAREISARLEARGILCDHVEDVDSPPIAAGADYAAGIDTVVVDGALKARAVRWLDDVLDPGVPLLTCCHAASATVTAANVAQAERVVGFALLPTAGDRAAVECARALQTGSAAAEAAETLWRSAGLTPEWVGDGAGLVLPRIVACLANEAAFAVSEGTASPADVDTAMRLGTRYPLGPIEWAARLGLDHVLAILDGLAAEHGEDRYRASPLLRRAVAAGRTRDIPW